MSLSGCPLLAMKMTIEADLKWLEGLNQEILDAVRNGQLSELPRLAQSRDSAYHKLFTDYSHETLSSNIPLINMIKQVDQELMSELETLHKGLASRIFDMKRARKIQETYTKF